MVAPRKERARSEMVNFMIMTVRQVKVLDYGIGLKDVKIILNSTAVDD
jgi:hypothetical protein